MLRHVSGNRLDKMAFIWPLLAASIVIVALFAFTGAVSAQTPTGSISGTVLKDDNTTPVVNAVVFVNDFTTGAAVANATTTASGTYSVTALGTGTYRVHVNATQQGFPIEYYDGTDDADSATSVAVTDTVDTPNIDFRLPTGGLITGTVFESNGTTPVSNADVWAEIYDCCGAGNGTRSAANGTYSISGLPAGDYRVQASATSQGFAQEFYDDTGDFSAALRVTLTSSSTASSIDFSLASGGSISGTVLRDSDSSPVQFADVWASIYDGGGGNGTQTDASGNYTISGLVAGDYRVDVRADGQGLSQEFYDDTTDWGLASRVAVTAGVTTSSIDFGLASGGSISGTVIKDSDSSPVEDAWVWAENYDCCGGNGAQTDSSGDYTIVGLLPGDYRVGVDSQEDGLASEFYDDTTDWSLASRVTVTSSSTTSSIDFGLASGGSISGTVIKTSDSSPIADAWVWAESYDCCGGNGVETDSSGNYTISGLATGNYRVQVFVGDQGFAGQFYDNQTDWVLADSVAVTSGATTPSIDFSLSTGGSISGTVYGADGTTPIANADIWADSYDCCGGGGGARSASDGTYTIGGLAGGDYRVQVFVRGQNLAGQFYDGETGWDDATRVTVTTDLTTTDIDFTLASGGSISGTIYQSDGTTPLANADVWADTYDCCGGNGTRSASNGTYTISGLAPGDYRVQVSASGGTYAGQFYDDTNDWDDADRVTVTASTTTSGIDFSLDAGGSISGTVYQSDGTTPLANVDVWANTYDCCGGGNGTRTASDGTYTISGLSSDDYRVEVFANGQSFAGEFYNDTRDWFLASRVTVTASTTTSGVDFTLDSGGSISGRITKDSDSSAVANAWVWAETFDCCGGNGAQSDSNGDYTITGLTTGSYRVSVYTDAVGLAGEFYSDTQNWDLATQVAVTSGATTANIDFGLASGGAISGTVTRDSDSSPVANADVWANSYNCCGGGGTRTDSNGNYTIDGLTAGEYRVEVNVFDVSDSLAGEFYDDQSDWNSADSVVVTSGSTTANINFGLASGGSISGTITDGSNPIFGANVWASDYDGTGGHGWARTDENGEYTISGISAGNYRVEAEAEGQVHKMYDNTTQWHLATSVAVTSGLDTPNIDFTLDSGGTITGTVYLQDGTTPVAGADVSAGSYDGNGGWGWAQSRSDGTYTINGLASGEYRLQAGAPQDGLTYQFYDAETSWDDAERVSVTSGATTANIDFNLGTGGSISGTVTEGDGTTPVVDAWVWAESYECCSGGNGTSTDSNGAYTIEGLGAGDYRVQVHASDQGFVQEFYDNTSDWNEAAEVTVTASQTTTGIDFMLGGGGSITGTATLEDGTTPVINAWVWAELYDCCGGNGGQTDSNGNYTITGLAPGDYRVQINAEDQGFTFEMYDDTNDWNEAERVAVTSGGTTTDIDFTLGAGGTISGQVLEIDGTTPVVDAWVWADSYDCCSGGNGGGTDSNGNYTISGLTSGDYRVQVNPPPGQGLMSEFYDDTTDWGDAARVAVTSGNTTGSIDFLLGAGGSIAGTVVKDSDSSPVANAWVWAETFNCCGGNGGSTDANGDFIISGLAPGDYRVGVFVDDAGSALAGEYYEDSDWDGADPVSVTASATTSNIDFSLASGGSISGIVTRDSDGTPVAGADVWAGSIACCGGGGTRSRPDGTFTITGLAANTYRVNASAPQFGLAAEFYDEAASWDDGDAVAVTAGVDTPDIDFSLGEGSTISGTVFEADGVTVIPNAEVFAFIEDDDGEEFEAETDANGLYSIIGLPPGDYIIGAVADDFALELYDGATTLASSTPITVPAAGGGSTAGGSSDVVGINFTLNAGGTISGTVTEDDGTTPIGFAEVIAIPAGSPFPPEDDLFYEETEPDGTYELDGLPAGDYVVFALGGDSGFGMEFYDNVVDPTAATNVTVTAGGDTTGINFTLSEGGSISGRVYQSDGTTPISDMLVIAEDATTGLLLGEADTEMNGKYIIEGLPAGSYKVYTIDDFGQGFVDEYYDDVLGAGSATPVVVTVPDETENINFILDSTP